MTELMNKQGLDCSIAQRIYTIDALRTFCNLLIVFVHVSAIGLVNNANSPDAQIVNFVCKKIAGSALPVLFLVSGYLLMRNYSFATWKDKLKKRLNALIVPYLSWNLLYVVILSTSSFIETGDVMWPAWKTFLKIFGIATQPADSPLWYVRSLLVWLLLVPILQFFMMNKRRRFWCLIVICICAVWFSGNVGALLGQIFPIYSIMAFSFGGVLALKKINLDIHLRKWKYVYVLLGLICYLPSPPCLKQVFTFMRGLLLLGLFAMVLDGVVGKLMKTKFYASIVQSAFFVYAAHWIICWKFEIVWRFLVGGTNILNYPLVGVLLTFLEAFAVILISIILYYIVNKLPYIGKVLSRH